MYNHKDPTSTRISHWDTGTFLTLSIVREESTSRVMALPVNVLAKATDGERGEEFVVIEYFPAKIGVAGQEAAMELRVLPDPENMVLPLSIVSEDSVSRVIVLPVVILPVNENLHVAAHHGERDEGWTGCYNRTGFGHPPAASQRRLDVAGREGYLPCSGSSLALTLLVVRRLHLVTKEMVKQAAELGTKV